MSNLGPVSVRVSDNERKVLQEAADHARTNLSDFIRRKAVEAAELELMERRVITIPAEKWEEFEAWMNSPPRNLPNLRNLLETKPVWED